MRDNSLSILNLLGGEADNFHKEMKDLFLEFIRSDLEDFAIENYLFKEDELVKMTSTIGDEVLCDIAEDFKAQLRKDILDKIKLSDIKLSGEGITKLSDITLSDGEVNKVLRLEDNPTFIKMKAKVEELEAKIVSKEPQCLYDDEPLCPYCGELLDLCNNQCKCGQVLDLHNWQI